MEELHRKKENMRKFQNKILNKFVYVQFKNRGENNAPYFLFHHPYFKLICFIHHSTVLRLFFHVPCSFIGNALNRNLQPTLPKCCNYQNYIICLYIFGRLNYTGFFISNA